MLLLLPELRRSWWKVHSAAAAGRWKIHAAAARNEEEVERWKVHCCSRWERGRGGGKFTRLLLPETRRWKVLDAAAWNEEKEVESSCSATGHEEEVEESSLCCCWERGRGGKFMLLLLSGMWEVES
jgi:hypothetical protein